MYARAKYLLMGVSILFIIFGCFGTLEVLVLMNAVLLSGNAWMIAVGFYLIAMCLAELALGIVGIVKSGNPASGRYYIVSGIVILILIGLNVIRNTLNGAFQLGFLIGLLLPALFIVGGIIRKNEFKKRPRSFPLRMRYVACCPLWRSQRLPFRRYIRPVCRSSTAR